MNYKQMNGKSIREAFEEFNELNPQVYAKFEQQAFKAIERGKKKISAKLIINWIRWNEYLETTGKPYRINDAFQSYYARLFIKNNTQYVNMFEFRRLRNED